MKCEKVITSHKIIDYRKNNFNGKVYCFDCQQEVKDKKKGLTGKETPVSSKDNTRETLIIRQTCIKAACEVLARKDFNQKKITEYAKVFEKWIMRQD